MVEDVADKVEQADVESESADYEDATINAVKGECSGMIAQETGESMEVIMFIGAIVPNTPYASNINLKKHFNALDTKASETMEI